MPWKIHWLPDGHGVATHAVTGASFHISRSGWVAVQESAGRPKDELVALIAELHGVLGTIAPQGQTLH